MANLPNKSFVFNYNARDYDPSTYTIPNDVGATMQVDMLLTGTSRTGITVSDDHIFIPVSTQFWHNFSSTSVNPLNVTSSNNNLTFVFKGKYIYNNVNTDTIRGNFFRNQDNNINWVVRFGTRENYPTNDTRISLCHNNSVANYDIGLSYTCGDTITAVVKIDNGVFSIKNIGAGESTTPVSITSKGGYGNASARIFTTYTGDFYWMYCSREVLTDEEIQQVIAYNDATGGIDISSTGSTFVSSGGTQTITVESTSNWSAVASDNWITVSPSTGTSGTTNVTIGVAGTLFNSRTGTVTFTDEEENEIIYTVTQVVGNSLILKNYYLGENKIPMAFRNGDLIYHCVTRLVFSVDTDELVFDSTGGTKTIMITANDKWTMTVPEWLTASALSGLSSATVSLTAGSTASGRTGNIVITCGGKTHTVSVEQAVGYEKMYLTAEALENGTFKIRVSGIGYSVNNGSWDTSSAGQQLSLSTGDKVRFKYTMTDGNKLQQIFSGTTVQHKMYGNIMSLKSGDNFVDDLSLTYASAFNDTLRFITGLTDASNVVLPATGLTQHCYRATFGDCPNLVYGPKELPATTLQAYCYRSMFQNCKKMVKGPDLPALTLVSNCYYNMFGACSVLNYIKCLATTINVSSSNTQWVINVQTNSGTFVKNPNISTSTWGRGQNGIPNNWTVEDEVI